MLVWIVGRVAWHLVTITASTIFKFLGSQLVVQRSHEVKITRRLLNPDVDPLWNGNAGRFFARCLWIAHQATATLLVALNSCQVGVADFVLSLHGVISSLLER